MNSCSHSVQLVFVMVATLVLAVGSQNYDIYSYNFDQPSRIPNVVEQPTFPQQQNFAQQSNFPRPNRIPNVAEQPTFQQQQNFAQQSNFPQEQKSCDLLSAVHRDQNGPYGSITISNPDNQNIVLRAIYSVAARLPSVRPLVTSLSPDSKKLAWKFPLELLKSSGSIGC